MFHTVLVVNVAYTVRWSAPITLHRAMVSPDEDEVSNDWLTRVRRVSYWLFLQTNARLPM